MIDHCYTVFWTYDRHKKCIALKQWENLEWDRGSFFSSRCLAHDAPVVIWYQDTSLIIPTPQPPALESLGSFPVVPCPLTVQWAPANLPFGQAPPIQHHPAQAMSCHRYCGSWAKTKASRTDATINPSAGPTVALGISVTVSVYKPPKAWAVYRKSRLLTVVQRWELHLAKSLFIQFSSAAPKQAYCWGPGLCRALLTVPVFLGQCHEHSRVFGATTA